MGTPYFNRDESIILTAHKIKFDSALSDVMLTNQRLILIDAGFAQFKPQTIPLTTIETVISGEDAYGNPIITLALASATPGGATETKELVFSHQTSGDRKQECSDWVRQLKEQVLSIRQELSLAANPPVVEDTDIIFDDTIATPAEDVPGSVPPQVIPELKEPVVMSPAENTRPEAPQGDTIPAESLSGGPVPEPADGSPSKTPLSSRFPPSGAPADKPNFSTIAAIAIVILAVAGGVLIYSNSLQVTPHDSPGTVTITTLPVTPAATTLVTPVQTTKIPEQTPTPLVTPQPSTRPVIPVPESGVWVRIRYEGNFAGQVGLSGGLRQVSGSGDQFYQVPTVNGVIDVTVEKLDGSRNVLAVDIYKNGTLVKNSTVATPRGAIDMHVDLKTV